MGLFFFQAEDGIRDLIVTGVQTCALPIAACVASLWGGEASRALLTGLGLAASATLGARLADDEPATRLVGSVVGVIVFAGFALLGPRLPTWASGIGTDPPLAAIRPPWGA